MEKKKSRKHRAIKIFLIVLSVLLAFLEANTDCVKFSMNT